MSDLDLEVLNNLVSFGEQRTKINSNFSDIETKVNSIRNSPSQYIIQVDEQNGSDTTGDGTILSPFASISKALSSITDNDVNNRYVIRVAPGIYTENNASPIALKEYVSIVGDGKDTTTRITVTDPTKVLFDSASNVLIDGVNFFGITSNAVVNVTDAHSIILRNVTFINCDIGVVVNNAAATLDLFDIAAIVTSGTMECVVHCINGLTTIRNLSIIGNSSYDYVVHAVGGMVNLSSFYSFSTNLGSFLYADGGSILFASGVISGADIAIYADNEATIQGVGLGISNSSNSDIIQNDVDSKIIGSGISLDLEKLNCVNWANILMSFTDLSEDDEAYINTRELHVGLPELGRETCLGEGDSTNREMLVYTYDGTYTNVTNEAKSASGSTFSVGNSENDALYLAWNLIDYSTSDYKRLSGIKIKIDAALESFGNFIWEYYNGTAWTEFKTFITLSSSPYFPLSDNLDDITGSYHIRFSTLLENGLWTKNDPVSLGGGRFWVRLRMTDDITTGITIEQIKMHTNRTEMNPDGWIEYFGNARPIAQLPFSIGSDAPILGNLTNQDIFFSENIGAGLDENLFNSDGDGIGRIIFLPYNLDPSSPINLKLMGRPTGSGDITMKVAWDYKTEGDTIYESNPSASETSQERSITKTVVSGQATIFNFPLCFCKVVSRREDGEPDFIAITISSETLGDIDFELAAMEATYIKWCEGGHIK